MVGIEKEIERMRAIVEAYDTLASLLTPPTAPPAAVAKQKRKYKRRKPAGTSKRDIKPSKAPGSSRAPSARVAFIFKHLDAHPAAGFEETAAAALAAGLPPIKPALFGLSRSRWSKSRAPEATAAAPPPEPP